MKDNSIINCHVSKFIISVRSGYFDYSPRGARRTQYAISTFENKPAALSRNFGRKSYSDATPKTRIAETSLNELLNKGRQAKRIGLFISERQKFKENSGNKSNNSELPVELMTHFRVL